VQLILFDCDGTLIDSQHLIIETMNRAFHSLDLECPARSTIAGTIGLSLSEAMRRLLPGGDADQWSRLTAAYREQHVIMCAGPAVPEQMFKGARPAVMTLAAQPDVLLGIATGKSRRGVQRFLEREGWTNLFATIQTADDAPSKPHPGMILNALAETGARRSHTVMIGDTTHDILMAKAAGVTGLGVAWGNHPEAALHEAGAAAVVHDFAGLTQFLTEPAQQAVA
jgi:phosphoglycolate phosphatase